MANSSHIIHEDYEANLVIVRVLETLFSKTRSIHKEDNLNDHLKVIFPDH